MPLQIEYLRNLGRRILLVAIGVNAALGVSALLGDFGDTQGKILLTSLLITAAAAVGLATAGAEAAGTLGWVPVAGIVATVAGFALLVVGVWTGFDSEGLWKTGLTGVIAGIAAALAALLSLVDLHGRHLPVRRAAYLLAFICAAILISAVWGRPNDEWGRILGIAFVLLAATAAAVPILGRSAKAAQADDSRGHCPFCGGPLDIVVGRAMTCPRCARSFTIQT